MQPTPLHRDLPERADAEIVARQIRFSLGGDPRVIRVLSVAENREWTANLATLVRATLGKVGPLESVDEVALLLSQSIDTMMDLLIAYDVDHELPERDWIDTKATDREVYEALKRVTAAAYPFGFDLRAVVPELVPALLSSLSRGIAAATVALSHSTSAPPQPTAGKRKRSKKS